MFMTAIFYLNFVTQLCILTYSISIGRDFFFILLFIQLINYFVYYNAPLTLSNISQDIASDPIFSFDLMYCI